MLCPYGLGFSHVALVWPSRNESYNIQVRLSAERKLIVMAEQFTEQALSFRRAERSDLPAIVGLLADDHLGAQRERLEVPLPASYDEAFTTINADTNQYLLVAVQDDRVVGSLLLSFLRGISRQGAWHARINEVRVKSTLRSHGIGQKMIEHVIEIARTRACGIIELTTDKSRRDAYRFYERLGFVAGHEGMSMFLKP